MRWQIAVAQEPHRSDTLGLMIQGRLAQAGLHLPGALRTARLYCVEGDLDRAQAETLARELFCDPVIEEVQIQDWESAAPSKPGCISIFRKPGVMDPVEAGILRAASNLGIPLKSAATGHRYTLPEADERALGIAADQLANPAIEVVVINSDRFPPPVDMGNHSAGRVPVPMLEASDERLMNLSRDGGLSLTLLEMQAIRAHFRELGREPTEIELESLAQTWSEHCKHKTLAGAVHYKGDPIPGRGSEITTENLLRDTIKRATDDLDRDFCLSVFHDNAGVISFEGDQALCIKVETHNHPSAIEPYGGAGTGIGGVIRDILGTGQGARPVANVDVFCVGPLDMEDVPKGAQHPIRILRGVVSGVRDYGNQMGIPTVNGAVFFDKRYVGNPLVYCGTVGVIPVSRVDKKVSPGERIVAIGGRTGRDGIHGATFSSAELHEESEVVDSGAVQIGNAITEKKVLDVLLQARDRDLFTAVTDCGAGGFSSAVGEMGEHCGARVHLERAPLKYAGLSPTEIWISEAQERMVFSVPQDRVQDLLDLCQSEDVEAVVLGEFTDTGRLELHYNKELVGDISMSFLHDGLPRVTREASWAAPSHTASEPTGKRDPKDLLLKILAHPNVASKEWIIRQYDHEVQAGSVVKPLVGTRSHGPSDGAVQAPILGSTAGFALGIGMNPLYGDLDPYGMALAAIDEALRNVVSVGGDPDHTAILDNFCWGNTEKPDRLGGLVRASYGCLDGAKALRTPFISGKDSLNNEMKIGDRSIAIPPSLLITALARVPDVRRAVTMDLKSSGSLLYAVGVTRDELGATMFEQVSGSSGGSLPAFDGSRALDTFRAVHRAITRNLIRSCHDMSEGGVSACAAEMVLAGEIGTTIDASKLPLDPTSGSLTAEVLLFSENLTRFLVEVDSKHRTAFEDAMEGIPIGLVGETTADPLLTITNGDDVLIQASAAELEAAWRPPLSRFMEQSGEDQHG